MSEGDWKPGDLALCVRNLSPRVPVRRGGVYRVRKVWDAIYGPPRKAVGLDFDHYADDRAIASRCFRKIRPYTPDAEDAETIRLLTTTPHKETVR